MRVEVATKMVAAVAYSQWLIFNRINRGLILAGKYFEEYRRRFCQAMDDDFSTPQAFAALFDLSREANTLLSEKNPDPEAVADAEHLFSTLGGDVLGIIPESLDDVQTDLHLKDVMEILIEMRANFRKNKDFVSEIIHENQLVKR